MVTRSGVMERIPTLMLNMSSRLETDSQKRGGNQATASPKDMDTED